MRMLLIDCRTADEPVQNIENVSAYLALYDVPIEHCTLNTLPEDPSVFEMVILFYLETYEALPAIWQENKPNVFIIVALPSTQPPPELKQFVILIDPAADGNVFKLMEAIEATPLGRELLMNAMIRHFGFTEQQLAANRDGYMTTEQRRLLRERSSDSRVGCLYLPIVFFLLLGLFFTSVIPLILLAFLLIWELIGTWGAIRGRCRARTVSFEWRLTTAKNGTVKREAIFLEGGKSVTLMLLTKVMARDYWLNRKFKVYTVEHLFTSILLSIEPLPLPATVQPTIGLWSAEAEASYAGRIRDHLTRVYGRDAISGKETLSTSMDGLAVLLLIIGPDWQRSALFDPTHPNHALLLAAGSYENIRIIPVLVNDAEAPDGDTAGPTQIIPWQSAARISDYSFTYDLRQLLHTLESLPAVQDCLRRHSAARFGFDVNHLPANRLGRFTPDQFRQFAAKEGLWGQFGMVSLVVLIPSLLTVLLVWAGQAGFAGLTGGLSLLMLVFWLTIGVIPVYQRRLRVVEGKPVPGGLSASHMGVEGSSLIFHFPSGLSRSERMEMEQRRYRFYYRTISYSPHLVNIEPIFDAGPEAPDQVVASGTDLGQGRILLAIRQPTSFTDSIRERLDMIYGTGMVQTVSTVTDLLGCIQRASVVLVGIDADWEQSKDFNTPDDVLCAVVDAAMDRNTLVLTILLDGAYMPNVSNPSPTLTLIGKINALTINKYNFEYNIRRIVQRLNGQEVVQRNEKLVTLEHYEQALNQKRELQDVEGEANALNSIGLVQHDLGETQKALDSYEQAFALYCQLENHRGKAVTLHNIGAVWLSAGGAQKALNYFSQALGLYAQLKMKDCGDEANTLYSIGISWHDLGQQREAINFYEQALALYRQLTDRGQEAAVLYRISEAWHDLGENNRAIEYCEQSLVIYQEVEDDFNTCKALQLIGIIQFEEEKYTESINTLTQAISSQKRLEALGDACVSLAYLGYAKNAKEDYQGVVEAFLQAISLAHRVGRTDYEAQALFQMGELYLDWGEYLKSIEYFEGASRIYRKLQDDSKEASTFKIIGGIFDNLGQKQKALQYYELALAIYRRLQDREEEAFLIKSTGKYGGVRRGAAYALGHLGNGRAVELLIAHLGDEDSVMRRTAAYALDELGDSRAVEPLIARLGDEDSDVRRAASWALGKLGDGRAVEPLIARLGDEDSDVRRAASWALGKLGDGRAVEPLIARLGDEDSDVRSSAAYALAEAKDMRALEPLIIAMRDDAVCDETERGRYFDTLADLIETALPSDDPHHDFIKAMDALIAGTYQESRDALSRAIAKNPKLWYFWQWRGEMILWLKGDANEAIADYSQAITLAEHRGLRIVELYRARGDAHNALGRFAEAEADYAQALALKPENPATYFQRGRTFYERAEPNYEAALADFGRAIQLNPNESWHYHWRGQTYYKLSRYAEALTDLDRAIQLNPDDPWNYHWRGLTYYELSRYAEALADLDRAIQLNPDDPWNYHWRGLTYYELSRYAEALADLDRAVELQPDEPENHYWRGLTYYQLGCYNEALSDFNRAVELQPDEPENHYWRGLTYYQLGRYDEALSDFNRAVELQPDEPRNHHWRGMIHLSLGSYVDTITHLDTSDQLMDEEKHYSLGINAFWRAAAYDLVGHADEASSQRVLAAQHAEACQKADDRAYILALVHLVSGEEDAARQQVQAALEAKLSPGSQRGLLRNARNLARLFPERAGLLGFVAWLEGAIQSG